jgi:hypothetical protein
MILQLEDQPLNCFSAPDLYASPQRTHMAAAVQSWIASLEFGEKFDSGLIGNNFAEAMRGSVTTMCSRWLRRLGLICDA